MLLTLILFQFLVLVTPNPFHKYPFVFLLDVGNEDLEKTNTEQIRLSVPGGSVALRYPAIGDGDLIVHVRVSGIDFGTDLKANIVDGGPGYKYVVLVFMGNPGVAYDAVVTVQTVDDQTFNIQNIGSGVNTNSADLDQDEENSNNSAEDLSDDTVVNDPQSEDYAQSNNAELMQSSSNVYNYAESEVYKQKVDDDDDDDQDNVRESDESGDAEQDSEELGSSDNDSESDDSSNQEDIHEQYNEDVVQAEDSEIQVKGVDTIDQDDDDNDDETGPKVEQNLQIDYEDENEPSIVNTQIDSKYDDLSSHLRGGGAYYNYKYDGKKVERPDYQQEPLDYEELDAEQSYFNDGEDHDRVVKYKDNNNNFIDSDDNNAVEY